MARSWEHTVRSRSHRQTLSADLEREDLARDHPGDRSPRRGKEKDEDADEGNARLLRGDVMHNDFPRDVLGGGGCAKDGDEKLRDGHADGAPEEERAAPELVDSVQAGERRADVDSAGDHLDHEGVGDARVLEVLGPVAGMGVSGSPRIIGVVWETVDDAPAFRRQ